MKHTIKEGEYRIGVCHLGRVLGVYPSLLDVSPYKAKKYAGADIETQWIASVNNDTLKMEGVILEIEWKVFDEKLSIYFPVKMPEIREFVKRVAMDKIMFIVNREPDDEREIQAGMGSALSVDISRAEVLEWIDLEDKGSSVKEWKPKSDDFNPLYKDGKGPVGGNRARF